MVWLFVDQLQGVAEVQDIVEVGSLALSTRQLNCTDLGLGNGLAFPVGSEPTTLADCQCTLGFEPITGVGATSGCKRQCVHIA